MAHLELRALPMRLHPTASAWYSANGKVYLKEEGKLLEYAPDSGELREVMRLPGGEVVWLTAFPDGKRLVEWDGLQGAQIVDLATPSASGNRSGDSSWRGTARESRRWR